jgi:CheY-like chemotaxis protein
MPARILIIEDNADNRKLMRWILEDAGYAFEEAGSVEAALSMLEQTPFDLVLMDISLPGIDGTEATRRLRRMAPYAQLPIIAVTAHAVKGEDEVIRASGVSALVTKPVDEGVLLNSIRCCLQKRA